MEDSKTHQGFYKQRNKGGVACQHKADVSACTFVPQPVSSCGPSLQHASETTASLLGDVLKRRGRKQNRQVNCCGSPVVGRSSSLLRYGGGHDLAHVLNSASANWLAPVSAHKYSRRFRISFRGGAQRSNSEGSLRCCREGSRLGTGTGTRRLLYHPPVPGH